MSLFKLIRKIFKKEKQIEKGYMCPRCNRITYIKINTKNIINNIYKFVRYIFNEDIVLIEDYEE